MNLVVTRSALIAVICLDLTIQMFAFFKIKKQLTLAGVLKSVAFWKMVMVVYTKHMSKIASSSTRLPFNA